jgi:hypothetical protein
MTSVREGEWLETNSAWTTAILVMRYFELHGRSSDSNRHIVVDFLVLLSEQGS